MKVDKFRIIKLDDIDVDTIERIEFDIDSDGKPFAVVYHVYKHRGNYITETTLEKGEEYLEKNDELIHSYAAQGKSVSRARYYEILKGKSNDNVKVGKTEAEKKAIAKQILDNVHKQQFDEEQEKYQQAQKQDKAVVSQVVSGPEIVVQKKPKQERKNLFDNEELAALVDKVWNETEKTPVVKNEVKEQMNKNSKEEVILTGVIAPGMPTPEDEFKRVTGKEFDSNKYDIKWTGAENYGEDYPYTPYVIVKKQEAKKAPVKTTVISDEDKWAKEALQDYRNSGYGKNAFGWYFNPSIDEYDENYDPTKDPFFNKHLNEKVAQKPVTEVKTVTLDQPVNKLNGVVIYTAINRRNEVVNRAMLIYEDGTIKNVSQKIFTDEIAKEAHRRGIKDYNQLVAEGFIVFTTVQQMVRD